MLQLIASGGKEIIVDNEFSFLTDGKLYTVKYGVQFTYKNEDGKWVNVPLSSIVFADRPKDMNLHFKDGNKLNYTRENVEYITNSQFGAMLPPFGSNKHKGVSQTKQGTFECRISINGKTKGIGTFTNEIAAANAYNYYSEIEFGSYRYINDVPYMEKEEWEQYTGTSIYRKKMAEQKEASQAGSECQHCKCHIPHTARVSVENKVCRDCAIEIARQEREAEALMQKQLLAKQKQAVQDAIIEKECVECHNTLPIDDFRLSNCTSSKCISCLKAHRKAYSARRYLEKREEIRQQGLKWRRNNRAQIKSYRKIRKSYERTRDRLLGHSLTSSEWAEIMERFDNKCPLTGKSDNLHMEHFIPLSWGHGGTHVGNVYPLDGELNEAKSNINPFEWAKEASVDTVKWNSLVEYLASTNGYTADEFKEYVYWCDENRRTVEELKEAQEQ